MRCFELKKYTTVLIGLILPASSTIKSQESSLPHRDVVYAEDESLMFLQQDKPGEFLYVVMTPHDNEAIVVVKGMGLLDHYRVDVMSLDDYDFIRSILDSLELQPFVFTPNDDEVMTGVDFYTVNIRNVDAIQYFIIPRNVSNDVAKTLVAKFQHYTVNNAGEE